MSECSGAVPLVSGDSVGGGIDAAGAESGGGISVCCAVVAELSSESVPVCVVLGVAPASAVETASRLSPGYD